MYTNGNTFTHDLRGNAALDWSYKASQIDLQQRRDLLLQVYSLGCELRIRALHVASVKFTGEQARGLEKAIILHYLEHIGQFGGGSLGPACATIAYEILR